ncbi:biorientation of chromosomes in cell division protein 1-like 1 [Portunus trituberculatus]|uniref:biorientation of chromosomes in cell division protein 1-like 1 n=1 Tax=Portunus trituberculatus TaxID=210409 RepID=UPI001E1CC64A|nr:biorientation of chromosomes in cell division protein 1-like 1 [Portunus trituberculatus]
MLCCAQVNNYANFLSPPFPPPNPPPAPPPHPSPPEDMGGRGAAPGMGGRAARNLLETHEIEEEEKRERRPVEDRVWENIASVSSNHLRPYARAIHTHPALLPHLTTSLVLPSALIEEEKQGNQGGVGGGGGGEGGRGVEEAYLTTGGDYGRFPAGWARLGRPPTTHTLNTSFTHRLAKAGMYRNHSVNM